MINILAINGSASANSSNAAVIAHLEENTPPQLSFNVWNDLSVLPHFQTEPADKNLPKIVKDFQTAIEQADGIIICTPEYVFSIPARLKNAIEWCVSTTVFSGKPMGLILASASGEKGMEELQLIMRTVEGQFTDSSCLLIQGVKGKISPEGKVKDENTVSQLAVFFSAFLTLIHASPQ